MSVYVIDPPWPKRKGGLRSVRPQQGRTLDYQTMSVEQIFQLLDDEVLPQEQHTVFLWTVDQFLPDAGEQMIKRGYRLHARLIWDKGNGVAPCFTVRYSHEYLLWFYKPKLTPVDDSVRGKFTTVIRAAAREHSRKPDEAYEMIAAMFPNERKVDVFSREKREQWEQWGNQCSYFSEIESSQAISPIP